MDKELLSAVVNQLALMIIIFVVMVIAYAVYYAIEKHKTGFTKNKLKIISLLFGYMIVLLMLTSLFMGNSLIRFDIVPQEIVQQSYILSNIILPIGDFLNNLVSSFLIVFIMPLILLFAILSLLRTIINYIKSDNKNEKLQK